jgi:hypothetical protein
LASEIAPVEVSARSWAMVPRKRWEADLMSSLALSGLGTVGSELIGVGC